MPEGTNVIPSRQLTEDLFPLPATRSTSAPILLEAGGSIFIPAQPKNTRLGKRVEGYSEVRFLGISDQPMSLIVEEACKSDGPFLETQTYASVAVGLLHRLCVRHSPCGKFARIQLTNTGGAKETLLSFCGVGLPVT
jgi:hypothetical protein